jgi:hypothetical protein
MNDQSAPTFDAVLAALGWKTTQAGAVTTLFAWVLSSQGTALVGMLMGATGLVIQFYYRRRQDRRDQEEHDARMKEMK